MLTLPDATLEYWGERFVRSGLPDVMTFERFLALSPDLRERRLTRAAIEAAMQERAERACPDAELHGERLIDPMCHGKPRLLYRPLFFRRRQHV